MLSILRSHLPTDEATIREALAEYVRQLEAHRTSEGVPAPWPQYEILRTLALAGEFLVVDDPADEASELTPEEVAAIERKRLDAAREAALGPKGEAVLIGERTYQIDDRFLMELLGMVMGLQLGVLQGPQRVRTRENEVALLGPEELVALARAVGDARRRIHERTWAAKDAL